MANILVAGGAGFIGSHLCKRLVKEGHSIYCIDNLITGNKTNISTLTENPKFQFLQHNITDSFTTVSDRFHEIHYIFHLASPASPSQKSEKSYINFPIETMLVNSVGTYNLLLLARAKNAQFLFASTSEVYGNPEVSPQPETYFGNVNPNGLRSVYDEGKRFGEAMIFGFKRKYGVNARIVRIFNTYGPFMQKDDGRVVTALINQALSGQPITIFGDGNQTRSFCYIDDMVDGIMKAMFSQGTDGQVFNLGNPDERKINDLAAMIVSMVNPASKIVYEPLPADDPLKRNPDITKARTMIGWEPKIPLTEGLPKTIQYFRNV